MYTLFPSIRFIQSCIYKMTLLLKIIDNDNNIESTVNKDIHNSYVGYFTRLKLGTHCDILNQSIGKIVNETIHLKSCI